MDKEDSDNESNSGQDETTDQPNDRPSDDPCYIHMCTASAQILQMLSHIGTSTSVQVIEIESLSEECESSPSSSPSSVSSSTPTSISDEANYVIWAEPIMTCQLVPAKNNCTSEVRRLPPGHRNVASTTHSASTTTGEPRNTLPGTCFHTEGTITVKKRSPNAGTSNAIFSEALKKMSKAADTIRQAKNVLSALTVNNNNDLQSVAEDDNQNEGHSAKDATSEHVTRTGESVSLSQRSQREKGESEMENKFPEPILVKSCTDSERSISVNTVSRDMHNMTMGDSGMSTLNTIAHTAFPQPINQRNERNSRLRSNALPSRAPWSSNMFDSDYQAARIVRYPRLFGPGYRRLGETTVNEDNSQNNPNQCPAKGDMVQSPESSISQKSTLNVGIGSCARESEIERRLNLKSNIPSATKSCSTTIRNKITVVDLKTALDLAIRNLEKNEKWKSYKNNMHTGADDNLKVIPNSLNSSPLRGLTLTSSQNQRQGSSRSLTPRENSAFQPVTATNENLKPKNEDALSSTRCVEINPSLSRTNDWDKYIIPISDVRSSIYTNNGETAKESLPQSISKSPLVSSKQKKVDFSIPLAKEIGSSCRNTDHWESEKSTFRNQKSPMEKSTIDEQREISHTDCSESDSVFIKLKTYFKPIGQLSEDDVNSCQTYTRKDADTDSYSGGTPLAIQDEDNMSDKMGHGRDTYLSKLTPLLERGAADDQNVATDNGHLEGSEIPEHRRKDTPIDLLAPPGFHPHSQADALDTENCNMDERLKGSSHCVPQPEERTTLTASPTKTSPRVSCSHLFETSPALFLGDTSMLDSSKEASVTCDKVLNEIGKEIIKEKRISEIAPMIIKDRSEADVAAKETSFWDIVQPSVAAMDAESQETDEDSVSVTVKSVSVSISTANLLPMFEFRSRTRRPQRKFFHDRHVSEFFQPWEMELLNEPFVIQSSELLTYDQNVLKELVQCEVIQESDEIETIELVDETFNRAEYKPKARIFTTKSGNQLKSILTRKQQNSHISDPKMITISDAVSFAYHETSEECEPEVLKKVKFDIVSYVSQSNDGTPFVNQPESLQVESQKEDASEDQKAKAKREPIGVRVRRFFRSCLRLSK
ncbi:hypothetical protein Bpfe_008276 [Biomphalaria pfeifferi]|uniref:Uncharacterized protein n=1 Tax=Biomphalaria pfeifferi TaxID=112525 RepID=A0AAD8BYJ2_BIOPF|nr:hypothetical protein Bpfe_008276 [Biomphalaria pfeifferi]